MKLYLMRHGIAAEEGPDYPQDSLRPLIDKGKKRLFTICSGLHYLEPQWDVILTSPYVRAKETAEIVANLFQIASHVREIKALTPGQPIKALLEQIRKYENAKSILIVGHEPTLSQHLSRFVCGTSSGSFVLKKGGVACVEFEGFPEEGSGNLSWLLPPSVIIRIGKKKD